MKLPAGIYAAGAGFAHGLPRQSPSPILMMGYSFAMTPFLPQRAAGAPVATHA